MDIARVAKLIKIMSDTYKADYRVVLYKDGSCLIEHRNFPASPVALPEKWSTNQILNDTLTLENHIEQRIPALESTKEKLCDFNHGA